MRKKVSIIPYVTLIIGYLIGAGILGIPVTSGLVGILPALILMTILMLVMFYSGYVIATETLRFKQKTFNIPSLYEKYFGNFGKWIATIANLIILYGALTAYLVGGTTIFTSFFHIQSFWINKLVLLVFFFILSGLCINGIELVKKCNVFLVFILWTAFIILVIIGIYYVNPAHFPYTNLNIIPLAAPIILTSFNFHNIIPNICYNSGWNKKLVIKAMLIGLIIGLILNALWFIIGVGVLPLNQGQFSIDYAYIHNLPALTPMTGIIRNPIFTISAMAFGFIAIISSYFGNGLGLLGFNQDILENTFKINNKKLNIISSFAPPLIISLIDPNIFLKAIDVVGGIGIVLLFGIIPCIISLIKPKTRYFFKIISASVFLIFLSIFCFEILQKTGMSQIKLPRIISSDKKSGKYNKIIEYNDGKREIIDFPPQLINSN